MQSSAGMMSTAGELMVLLSAPSQVIGEGRITLAKKTLTGMELYHQLWGGPLRMVLPQARTAVNWIDEETIDTRPLPFSIEVLDLRSPQLRDRIKGAAVVMGGANYEMNGLSWYCRKLGVPYVFNSEYTLRTRWQIAMAELPNGARLLRRMLWEGKQELANLAEVALASGVQCNGTPTFDAYRRVNDNTLLYFDTRTERHMLAQEADVAARLARRAANKPLRLLFSGRFVPMKGTDELPKLAKALRDRGVPFHLDICGAGPLEGQMRHDVERDGLSQHVTFRGVLDFATELMPLVRREVDLFVCCHRQGDPSCTYLETFACGVPIVGYANEAFAGLLARANVGQSVPIDDVAGLATLIERAARPESLPAYERQCRAALALATEHTFEATFERRIEHLRTMAAQRRAS
jgi:colanic acid/amylovoran biosynthesis glycosyltransferase